MFLLSISIQREPDTNVNSQGPYDDTEDTVDRVFDYYLDVGAMSSARDVKQFQKPTVSTML
jgi:hypothetical protein